MTTLVRLVVAGTLLAPVPALAQAPATQTGSSLTRLGSFSPQQAFRDSAEGKAGIAKLAALQEKRAAEIAERNKALQTQEEALQGSLSVLADEIRIQRTKDLDKFRIDVQRFIQDAQAEVAGVQRDIETGFLTRLRPAIEQVAREKGLQLVFNLDAGTMVWSDPAIDITRDVVERLARADVPKER
jgi:Skp family chaperone for outer membrane proteins